MCRRFPALMFCLLIGCYCGFDVQAADVNVVVIPAMSHDVQHVRGEIVAWNETSLSLRNDQGLKTFPLTTVRRIEFVPVITTVVPMSSSFGVRLTNDDWIQASAFTIQNERVTLTLPRIDETSPTPPRVVTFGLELLREVAFDSQTLPNINPTAKDDCVRLRNGNLLQGQLLTLDGDQLTMQTVLGTVETACHRIASLSMNPALMISPETSQVHALLYLRNGTVLTATQLEMLAPDSLVVKLVANNSLQLSFTELSRIDFYNARFVSLTEFPVAKEKCLTYFGTEFSPLKNRSLSGQTLTCDQRRFARGWGLNSFTELTFAVPPDFDGLHADIGLDDSTHGKGHVIASLLLDGKTVFEEEISGSKSLNAKSIDLSQSSTFTLQIDFGGKADIHDLTNWCDPVLIRD